METEGLLAFVAAQSVRGQGTGQSARGQGAGGRGQACTWLVLSKHLPFCSVPERVEQEALSPGVVSPTLDPGPGESVASSPTSCKLESLLVHLFSEYD